MTIVFFGVVASTDSWQTWADCFESPSALSHFANYAVSHLKIFTVHTVYVPVANCVSKPVHTQRQV